MVHLSCHQMYVNAAREQNGNGSSSLTCFSCRRKADSVIRCFPQLEERKGNMPSTERTKELQEQLNSLHATLINVMKDRIQALKEIDDFKGVLEQNHNFPSSLDNLIKNKKRETKNLIRKLHEDLNKKRWESNLLERKYSIHLKEENKKKAAEETNSWSDID